MNNISLFAVNRSMVPVVLLLVLSDLILRGVALYKSAKKEQKIWFVALLLINSLGLLPLIYLLINKDIRIGKSAKKPKK